MSSRSRAVFLRGVENLHIIGFIAMIAMVFGHVVLRNAFSCGITASAIQLAMPVPIDGQRIAAAGNCRNSYQSD